MFGSKKKKKKSLFVSRIKMAFYVACAVGILLLANLIYQVVKKPSELIGAFDKKFHKSPTETWANYGETFQEKSTSVMTPEFLAALAQAESNGNPVARTYWKVRLTTDIDKIYSPASSSAGMFQITKGTFEEAKQFCVRNGEVFRQSPKEESGPCWSNFAYSRMIPSHAIEMTSARLHFFTKQILARFKKFKAALSDQQSLATIIHLCGVAKGETFARSGFRSGSVGRCGDHDPGSYIRRIKKLQAQFRQLREKERLLARSN